MKKLLLIVFLLSASFVSAQETSVTLDNFSGGLATKPSGFKLPPTHGDIVENLRLDTKLGSLSKRDKIVTDADCGNGEAILGLHRLYLSDGTEVTLCNHGDDIKKKANSDTTYSNILHVSSGDRRWQWLTWHDIGIGTDGFNQPVKYDGSSTSATYLGSALAKDAGSGAGPNGTYTYKIACYTASYTISLNTASNSVTVTDNDITLTMIPVCPDTFLGETTVGRKIYRIENAGSTYKLLSNGTIADNSTVTLTDSDADGALGATLSPTHTRAPPKGKYIVVHRNRLWIANNPDNPSTIYYSADGSHDFFDTGATVNGGSFDIRPSDGDEITFVKNLFGKLTISKNNTIQYLNADGDEPSADWAISDPYSFVGCQAPYSAVNSPIGIIYLGNNGIYAFSGQYSKLLSDPVTPEIRDISPSNFPNVWGEYYKNGYYLAYTSFETGSSVNDRVLIYDTLSNAFMKDLLSINVFKVFNSGGDVEALFSGASNNGLVYAHTETAKQIIHRRHSDFTGTFDDMRYIPTRWGGDAESPVLELAWTTTIDEMTGTIDAASGIIDRPDTDGKYFSQYLTVNASSLDKIYWNEILPAAGGDVTFALRTGDSTAGVANLAWSSEFSATGADISSVTGDTILQYRISMSTSDIDYTPTLVSLDNYVVKLTFNRTGTTSESTIPVRWRSGWLDLGYPDNAKTLKKMSIYYSDWPEDTSGTLNVQFENFEGDTDLFAIDLQQNPEKYTEFFTGGSFPGNIFRITLTESSLNPIKIDKIILRFEVEPKGFLFPNDN